jgi:hypothetical protein
MLPALAVIMQNDNAMASKMKILFMTSPYPCAGVHGNLVARPCNAGCDLIHA